MTWKVALYKVEVVEQEFSLHPSLGDALAAVDELEKFLGIQDGQDSQISVQRSPITGEQLMIVITGEAQ